MVDLHVEWFPDWDICISGDHADFFGNRDAYPNGNPETCEYVVVRNEEGNVWASLGCIDDADEQYRKEIEKELLDEAQKQIEREAIRTLSDRMQT